MRGRRHRLDEVVHVDRFVVTGRPVAPELGDELVVVHRHREVGERVELEEHVPAQPELLVREERLGGDGSGRYRRGDDASPAMGCDPGTRVGTHGAPVVPDQHGVGGAAEGLVECVCVDAEHAGLIPAVGGERRGGVAAVERCDGSEARRCELGKQVSPGVRRVGVAVQAERQRAGAHLEVREVDSVRRDVLEGVVHLGHRGTLRRRNSGRRTRVANDIGHSSGPAGGFVVS